jgi:hypothetical protein
LAQEDFINKPVDVIAEADKDIGIRVMESIRDAHRNLKYAKH